MKIILGLGNPGKKYAGTRHNVGFDTLEQLAKTWSAEPPRSRFEGLAAQCSIENQKSLLVWPQTYMNRSGITASSAVNFYKTALENVLVVCDDFNLPLGALRYRAKGSSGGQNGLGDIIQRLGTDEIPRLRIGVGPVPERWNPADFVLGRFSAEENDQATSGISLAAESIGVWVESGIAEAMNRYN